MKKSLLLATPALAISQPALADEPVYGPTLSEAPATEAASETTEASLPIESNEGIEGLSAQIHMKTAYVLADGGLYSNEPVAQPEITYDFGDGFYAGAWANVGESGRNELDLYVGKNQPVGNGTLNVQLATYDIEAPGLGTSPDIVAPSASYSLPTAAGDLTVGGGLELTEGRNGFETSASLDNNFVIANTDLGLSLTGQYGQRTGQVRDYVLGKVGLTIGLAPNLDATFDVILPIENDANRGTQNDGVLTVFGLRQSL